KYWAIIKGYHVHKSVLGIPPIIAGIALAFNNLFTGIASGVVGIGIIALDTIGHMHTNWHKKIVFIEKHKGSKYKKGGYKKLEVTK
ncbi:hypothetical protein KKG52_02265, partial [Patescibacteria group bacterium]|nr:hypothetical protein [Patescibacteria group bacterium]